jgi:GNAT superfamily N-acetyltransferase
VIHNNKKLLIECHGDHWHKGKERQERDQAKATFINNYFDDYELFVIWEYEYRSLNRIKSLIMTKLGIEQPPIVKFEFADLNVGISDITEEIKCFLATNHYLANIGRYGSLRMVATHAGKIVAAAVYAHPTRKESYERLGVSKSEIMELTRFCIHPSYQKKNFASWFLSRTMTMVIKNQSTIKVLLTFADSSFGHKGTIYKAANWQSDGIIKPDYWYRDDRSWFHKKSIWDLANKNNQTEAEYATAHGLRRVMGREKFRFIYWFPQGVTAAISAAASLS